jgi:hypothetical protein
MMDISYVKVTVRFLTSKKLMFLLLVQNRKCTYDVGVRDVTIYDILENSQFIVPINPL